MAGCLDSSEGGDYGDTPRYGDELLMAREQQRRSKEAKAFQVLKGKGRSKEAKAFQVPRKASPSFPFGTWNASALLERIFFLLGLHYPLEHPQSKLILHVPIVIQPRKVLRLFRVVF